MRTFACVSVAFCLVSLTAGAHDQGLRSGVSTVQVYASVVDRTGAPITGLPESAFTLLEDGRQRPISIFASGRQPLSAVLLLDESPTLFSAQERVRAAASSFLSSLGLDDVSLVGRFSHLVEIGPEPIRSVEALNSLLRKELEEFPAGTALWDAIENGVSMLEKRPGRRAVLVITDGFDNSSQATAAQLRAQIEQTGIMVFGVGFRGEKGLPGRELSDLARASGGRLVEMGATEDPAPGVEAIVAELRNQYLLGFEPTRLDGKAHRIEVRVRAPGATVRARTSYIALR